MELPTILSLLGVLVMPAFWHLLSKKDEAQEKQLDALKQLNDKLQKQIDLLFKKHDDDVAALRALEVQIAKEHYLKHELDQRFQSLESTFREGFGDLRTEFKELARVLIEHVAKEDRRG